MSDAQAQGAELTRLFNRTTQPRVLQWGSGVVMPGESFLTDHPETFSPDQPDSPWTVDAEATGALLRLQQDGATNPSDSSSDGPSGAQDAPQGANQGVPEDIAVMANPGTFDVRPNGEVVNESGQVVGFVNPTAE